MNHSLPGFGAASMCECPARRALPRRKYEGFNVSGPEAGQTSEHSVAPKRVCRGFNVCIRPAGRRGGCLGSLCGGIFDRFNGSPGDHAGASTALLVIVGILLTASSMMGTPASTPGRGHQGPAEKRLLLRTSMWGPGEHAGERSRSAGALAQSDALQWGTRRSRRGECVTIPGCLVHLVSLQWEPGDHAGESFTNAWVCRLDSRDFNGNPAITPGREPPRKALPDKARAASFRAVLRI